MNEKKNAVNISKQCMIFLILLISSDFLVGVKDLSSYFEDDDLVSVSIYTRIFISCSSCEISYEFLYTQAFGKLQKMC